jgi:hypothetical protein
MKKILSMSKICWLLPKVREHCIVEEGGHMPYILCRSDQIAATSFDTQLFIITEKSQEFLLSFSGFLDAENQSLMKFEPHEVIIYSKNRAAGIKEGLQKQNLRRVEFTSGLKSRLADWIMETEVLLNL